jgi:large subunit ribosomal protein L17
MRHRKAGRKFKRSPEHRRMLLRNLATALLEHGRIETTLAKAKEVQPFTEKLITLAKDGWNLNNFRRVLAVLTKKDVAFKLFKEIGPRYKDRPGGYTRIYKLAKVRQGDAAPMGVIALLGADEQVKAPAKPAVVAGG